jgi:hypothetical protein
MKPDIYTKIALTVIALSLVMIACNQYVHPVTAAEAQGPFAGVQYSGPNGYSFFDTRTGDIWEYYEGGPSEGIPASWGYVGKVTKFGQPLAAAPK